MNTLGFNATQAQYRRQFEKWGLRKYISTPDWKRIDNVIKRRAKNGKESVVMLRGNEV